MTLGLPVWNRAFKGWSRAYLLGDKAANSNRGQGEIAIAWSIIDRWWRCSRAVPRLRTSHMSMRRACCSEQTAGSFPFGKSFSLQHVRPSVLVQFGSRWGWWSLKRIMPNFMLVWRKEAITGFNSNWTTEKDMIALICQSHGAIYSCYIFKALS